MGRTGLRAIWRSVWQDVVKGWSGGGDQEGCQVSVCVAEMMAPLIRTGSKVAAHLRMKAVSFGLDMWHARGEQLGCHNLTDPVLHSGSTLTSWDPGESN